MESIRKKQIVIWGAGRHAMVVAHTADIAGGFEVCGFLDDINPVPRVGPYKGRMVLGGREVLATNQLNGVDGIALGIGDCLARLSLGKLIQESGFQVPTIIHPTSAIASDVLIGEGSVILAGAVIDPGCRIGKFCIINNNATICHDSSIEDGCHICPGTSIAGGVTIGRGTWIGIGAAIIENIFIGEGSLVGAGAVVIRSIPARSVCYGNPARVSRKVDGDGISISDCGTYPRGIAS